MACTLHDYFSDGPLVRWSGKCHTIRKKNERQMFVRRVSDWSRCASPAKIFINVAKREMFSATITHFSTAFFPTTQRYFAVVCFFCHIWRSVQHRFLATNGITVLRSMNDEHLIWLSVFLLVAASRRSEFQCADRKCYSGNWTWSHFDVHRSWLGLIQSKRILISVKFRRPNQMKIIAFTLFGWKVAWLRVDTQTILTIQNQVITKNQRIGITNTENRIWQLHIKDVKESDHGAYMVRTKVITTNSRAKDNTFSVFVLFFSVKLTQIRWKVNSVIWVSLVCSCKFGKTILHGK